MLIKVYCPGSGPNQAVLDLPGVAALYEAAGRERQLAVIGRDVAAVSPADFAGLAERAPLFFAGYRPADGAPLGFVYLSHPEGYTARLHFALFRAGRPDRRRLGRLALGFCFKAYPWRSLIGLVPATFTGAVQYARELGGLEMGLILGACWMARLGRAVAGVQFLFLPQEDE